MASDTKGLIEDAVRRVLAEVPALDPLKIVVALELRVAAIFSTTGSSCPDQRCRRSSPTTPGSGWNPPANFNELATKGTIKHWREAFEHGDAKAIGPNEILRLIANVIEKQEERDRTRRPRTH